MTETNKSMAQIYSMWVKQLEHAKKNLPLITHAADIWAQQVVKNGGEVYASGDYGFWRENVHRAGGIGFVRKLTPDVVLDKNDVVLVGFEYTVETNRKDMIEPILKSGATILLFAESGADKEFINSIHSPNQLILIPCDKDLDGLLSYDSVKYVSLSGMTNILNMWVTSAEFVSACTRLGCMPNMFVSNTYPQGQSLNATLFVSRFYQDNTVAPVEKGILGKLYLNKIQQLSRELTTEASMKNISEAAHWTADAVKENRAIEETLSGHWADNLFFNNFTPKFLTTKQSLKKGDLRIRLEYNYYPNTEIEPLLNKGIRVVFMCTSDKDNDKFKGIKVSGGRQALPTWEEIPKREDLLLIDGHWPQYDSTLTLPDYPYPFIPSSWVAHGLVHWILVADTLNLLSNK